MVLPESCLRCLGTVCVDDSGRDDALSCLPVPLVPQPGLLPLPVPRSESSAQPVLTLQKVMKPEQESVRHTGNLDGLVLSQPTSQLEGEASGCDDEPSHVNPSPPKSHTKCERFY